MFLRKPNEDKRILTLDEIRRVVRPLAEKYRVEAVFLFGSYARGEAHEESDLDFLVYGGEHFKLTRILSLGGELRRAFGKNVDTFEIREVDETSPFYKRVMEEKVLVA